MVDETQTTATAPASTTTPAAPSAPAIESPAGDQTAPGDFDFGALAVSDDDAQPSGEAAPTGTPSAAPASLDPATAATPAPQVPPTPVASAPPTPPTEQPAAQPPPAATAPESAPGAVPELTIDQHREKFLPQLAKLYSLSDAEVELLRVNPGEALPQLASKLHYEVQMATYQGIVSVIPQMIAQAMQGREASTKNEEMFFGKWPALKDAVTKNPAAAKVITDAISSFSQLNPKATLEERIAHAGMLAMMTLKLPLGMPQGVVTNGAGSMPPSAPTQVPAMPARPPGIGATGHVPQGTAPGAGDEASLISDIVEGHLRGDY